MGVNKRRLVLDFDNTLVDTSKELIRRYAMLNRLEVPGDYCLEWNMEDLFPNPRRDVIHTIFSSRAFFNNLEFFPNCREVLERLSHHTDIIICSIGDSQNIKHKIDFVNDFLPFAQFIPIIKNGAPVMDKSMVNMEDCIFLDDHMDNIHSSNADVKILFKYKDRDYAWASNPSGCMVATEWDEDLEEALMTLIYKR